eukprot:Gb_30397 [translate_table: standard]
MREKAVDESKNEARRLPSKSRASRWDKDQPQAKSTSSAEPIEPTKTPIKTDGGTGPSSHSDPNEAQMAAADPPESNRPPVDLPAQESSQRQLDSGYPNTHREAQAVASNSENLPRSAFVGPRSGSAVGGFDMLEKRSITMGDGTVRTYYALPPDASVPFPAGNNAVVAPPFDNANFGSREPNVGPYGRENQFSAPENVYQNQTRSAHGLQVSDAEYLSRKAEHDRFYAENPMAPPHAKGLGLENYGSRAYENPREVANVDGSISRDSRDRYGNAGMVSSSSAADMNYFQGRDPAAGFRPEGSMREGYSNRNLSPNIDLVEGSRIALSPQGYQVSPRSGARMPLHEPFYGSADNPLKRKYAEEEILRDGVQRGLVDDREYFRRVREMELEEHRRREQGRLDFPHEKYLEEEARRYEMNSMSRPLQYESPHGASASRMTPNDKSDLMHAPSGEPWMRSPHMRTSGPSNWGRQDLHYQSDLTREMDDEPSYGRPLKYQKQTDAGDNQLRHMTEHHGNNDALQNDRNSMQQAVLPEDSEEFKQQVHRAYLRFAKLLNENPGQRKRYQDEGKSGSLLCVVCSRQSKDFVDTHSLVMHTYNSQNPLLRAEHLGLHKALCVLMGWSHASQPDNARSYQSLPSAEATENREDLILWPPLVIVHNACSVKKKDGRLEGIGNKEMDEQLRELGFSKGKSKAVYGRDGHQGIVVVKFAPTSSGFEEAERLLKYFEVNNHGRKDWLRVESSNTTEQNDDENPDLVQTDEKTKAKKRVLYGYIATAGDLEKVDFDTRKKAVVKSRKELDTTADGPVGEP